MSDGVSVGRSVVSRSALLDVRDVVHCDTDSDTDCEEPVADKGMNMTVKMSRKDRKKVEKKRGDIGVAVPAPYKTFKVYISTPSHAFHDMHAIYMYLTLTLLLLPLPPPPLLPPLLLPSLLLPSPPHTPRCCGGTSRRLFNTMPFFARKCILVLDPSHTTCSGTRASIRCPPRPSLVPHSHRSHTALTLF